MSKQKFKKYDLIVARCLVCSERESGIVMGSYADQYGGGDVSNYKVHFKCHGKMSWVPEDDITFIKESKKELLKKWSDAEKREDKLKGDIDWIFKNGKDVIKETHGSTVAALGGCLGINDMWGSRGEGFVYYQNAYTIMHLAKPFLDSGDKAGFMLFAKECVNV